MEKFSEFQKLSSRENVFTQGILRENLEKNF